MRIFDVLLSFDPIMNVFISTSIIVKNKDKIEENLKDFNNNK